MELNFHSAQGDMLDQWKLAEVMVYDWQQDEWSQGVNAKQNKFGKDKCHMISLICGIYDTK